MSGRRRRPGDGPTRRHYFSPRGTRSGSLGATTGGETHVRGGSRHRANGRSDGASSHVRCGHGGVGSVLRERGRARQRLPRPSTSPGAAMWIMRLRSRRPPGRDGSIAGYCRRPREELSRGYVGAILYLPTLRALFALNAHDATARFNHCRPRLDSTSAVGVIGANAFFGGLYPVYVRGQAYLTARSPQGRRRVPADCRSSKHRARRSDGCDGALAAGEVAGALGRYREGEEASTSIFLRYGRMPTADIPVLTQARAEYARLP